MVTTFLDGSSISPPPPVEKSARRKAGDFSLVEVSKATACLAWEIEDRSDVSPTGETREGRTASFFRDGERKLVADLPFFFKISPHFFKKFCYTHPMEGANPSTESGAENRERQAEKLVNFLRRSRAYDYVQQIFSNKIERPDFEYFQELLLRINGMIRNIPKSGRDWDGEKVALEGFVETKLVPDHQDKFPLLREAYEAASELDRADAAYLLPAAINAVHLAADGNGRTSRVLHILLGQHNSEEECLEQIRKALGKYGRFDTLDINPGLVDGDIEKLVLQNHGWTFGTDSGWNPEHGDIDTRIAGTDYFFVEGKPSPNLEKYFQILEHDHQMLLTATWETLGKKRVAELRTNRYENKRLISPLVMEEKLTPDEWAAIFRGYYALKREHVQTLINIFREPEKYRVQTAHGEVNLKDNFKQKIEEKFEEIDP